MTSVLSMRLSVIDAAGIGGCDSVVASADLRLSIKRQINLPNDRNTDHAVDPGYFLIDATDQLIELFQRATDA